MSQITELLAQERYQEVWQLCCGFLDLNTDQFMQIQEQLLLEQLASLQNCKMGRKLLAGTMPQNRRGIPGAGTADHLSRLLSGTAAKG